MGRLNCIVTGGYLYISLGLGDGIIAGLVVMGCKNYNGGGLRAQAVLSFWGMTLKSHA